MRWLGYSSQCSAGKRRAGHRRRPRHGDGRSIARRRAWPTTCWPAARATTDSTAARAPTSRFALKAAEARTVPVALRRFARRSLREAGRLEVELRVETRNARGHPVTLRARAVARRL
jgi:hypothetical protein